jgi:hypothetical protein
VLAQLEAAEAEVVAAVERQAGAWEPLTAAEVEKATELMRGWVAQALDAGGVRRARSLIKGVSWRLDQWVIGAEQRRVELEADLEQIIRDTEAIRTALAGIVGQMPGRSLRSLLRLLRNPFRWVQFWGRWRKAGDLLARHYLVAAAALETRVTARQLAHAADVYLALGDALETISQEVEQLESDLRDLFSPGECPPWPDASTDLLGDAPDEVLARLAERLLPPVPVQVEAFLERWGALSRWGEGTVVEEGTVSQWLSERTAPLATCSVWDVARCRFEQPDALRTWLEAWVDPVYPLWRWDPAALSEDERAGVGATKVFFSAPDGVRIWEDDGVGPRVLPLSRPDRMAVVALRWGIPDRSSEEV